ncbi:hypothetical protein H1C71_034029 [Ictidomys tridecemlineatus]|nr:hypothetical protein H1C71_034029 [Ictidomys tridecemlineatus]
MFTGDKDPGLCNIMIFYSKYHNILYLKVKKKNGLYRYMDLNSGKQWENTLLFVLLLRILPKLWNSVQQGPALCPPFFSHALCSYHTQLLCADVTLGFHMLFPLSGIFFSFLFFFFMGNSYLSLVTYSD